MLRCHCFKGDYFDPLTCSTHMISMGFVDDTDIRYGYFQNMLNMCLYIYRNDYNK